MKQALRLSLVLVLGAMLSGCVSDDAATVHSVWRSADAASAKRTVYFVTDREPDSKSWDGFSPHWADAASCGVVRVLVPPANLPGDPAPDATLIARPAPLTCGADRNSMSGIVATIAAEAARNHCHSVLVFVHGFNTAFYGALTRAGQMALDTQSNCAVAAFSWSSESNISRYASDIEHSSYAVPVLESFLRALADSGLHVDIIAHSVGTRVTLSALSSLARHPAPPRDDFIDQLVLAAADVGVEPGNDDFGHLLRDAAPFARRMTIYASAGDAVLVVSEEAHGGVPRAGREPLADRQYQSPLGGDHTIDVVSATEAPGDSIGHSYFALSYEAVGDISLVLAGVPAAQRLVPKSGWPATLVCMRAKEEGCDGPTPLYALNVSKDREPGFVSRLIRFLVPLIPRIDMTSIMSSMK
jgi:esterase/lipase superfamily enzyme